MQGTGSIWVIANLWNLCYPLQKKSIMNSLVMVVVMLKAYSVMIDIKFIRQKTLQKTTL